MRDTILAEYMELRRLMAPERWQQECVIETSPEGARSTVKVRYDNDPEHPAYLRYSRGPLQGFLWDVYGDDMQSVPLALLAIYHAPVPRSVAPIKFSVPLQSPPSEGDKT